MSIKWAIAENMVTVTATAAVVLGLYAMGAGGWAAGGLILLVNLNTSYRRHETEKASAPTSHNPETGASTPPSRDGP